MIPKIIHYCWFGNGEKSKKIKACMETWKEIMPDYEIVEWSEKDLHKINNKYLEEAYACKKWAFVSDIFRLYALKEIGGIYLDTDVETLKPFDEFLSLEFFIGTEVWKKKSYLATAVIGAQKGNELIQEMYDFYADARLINEDGNIDYISNTQRLTKLMMNKGAPEFYEDGKIMEILPHHKIYPVTYFSKKNKNAYAVHYAVGSWGEDWKIKEKFSLSWFNNQKIVFYKGKRQQEKAKFELPGNEKLLFALKVSKNGVFACAIKKKK